jgi:translation initiation factor 1
MAKKPKIEVRPSGSESTLKHNPFGALSPMPLPAGQSPAPSHDASPIAPGSKQRARLVLRREKKGRGGKTVVIISGFGNDDEAKTQGVAELSHDLKQHLGCGGAVESNAGQAEIVIQGDQPARVAELLRARGHRVSGVTQ